MRGELLGGLGQIWVLYIIHRIFYDQKLKGHPDIVKKNKQTQQVMSSKHKICRINWKISQDTGIHIWRTSPYLQGRHCILPK